LPSIGAFYNYQRNAQRDEFNFFDFNEKWYPIQLWGVQMTIPLFTGLGRVHSIEKAKIEQERAELGLKQVAAAAELEYAAARSEYLNALENDRIQKESLELADRIYARTQTKYREGIVGSFDLTQAQNQWLNAQGNAVAATLQLLNAKTRLNKALSNL
jgi:outer membrane protein